MRARDARRPTAHDVPTARTTGETGYGSDRTETPNSFRRDANSSAAAAPPQLWQYWMVRTEEEGSEDISRGFGGGVGCAPSPRNG